MSKLRIIPLGGLGEIGKNMMVYEYGDDIMVVDTGIMFPENDMLGVDYIIPDFQYSANNRIYHFQVRYSIFYRTTMTTAVAGPMFKKAERIPLGDGGDALASLRQG